MINHIVNECSKLERKKYKTRYNWVGEVIHWKLCKKLKFDDTTKWFLHKTKSVVENKTHEILWGTEGHLIPSRRPDLVLINKKIGLVG